MKVIKAIKDIDIEFDTVVTIGNFDGVHKGHQVLIEKTATYAKARGIKSAVFTFLNHPINYFVPEKVKNIFDEKEKERLIEGFGIDYLIDIPFDKAMTQISAEQFIVKILKDKIHAKKIVVGYDFTFARNKEGTVDVLREMGHEYGIEVEIVQPIKINGIRVSSTFIRELISEGRVDEIPQYLGTPYVIEGEIIHGKANGRKMGYPTANISLKDQIIKPKNGIYASRVIIDGKKYFGATNVGMNPTVNGKYLSIETNILDFDEDIYGKRVRIEFLEKIRDEKKFESLDELRKQLDLDTGFVRQKYLSNNKMND
ncbi:MULTISPECIES: bifunctional riboflavin kinase/FAD synthetase [Peptostreptococcales]|uniref:bifunctional riboflavin kinase/FAD synthetase n=1 Tax=Peptostreptococcales TaxID=3082720 RepID=UPI000E4BC8FC|nr:MULTISPECIES: bifunctional riboflavin kinase/FAD synthetase [Peptostreptococcaceae]MEE0249292.1 bifunctional riboflavin kinase/FAD synthetase [Peptacetobacter hiranonis]QQQ85866.1 bifunctional riboflavin kinase/FAD synthetase [Peptacetobacter hiranonis]RHQ99697.1 bifunctional riboflavin kinase/FAD synthetase [Peptoclostridium sp. AF21-18]